MRVYIQIGDTVVEVTDQDAHPTLEGLESILSRVASTAIAVWNTTEGDAYMVDDEYEDEDEEAIGDA